MDNETLNGVIMGSVLFAAFIVVGLVYWFIIHPTPMATLGNTSGISVVPSGNVDTTYDFNEDGSVDYQDKKMIEDQMGCSKGLPCWEKEVGKTRTGYNPIYTYDLDIDKDYTITQKDLDMVK